MPARGRRDMEVRRLAALRPGDRPQHLGRAKKLGTVVNARSWFAPYPIEMQDAVVAVVQRARFEELYRERGPALWRSLVLYTGDQDVASDAVSEAFAQAIRRGDEIRSPMAWIARAAYRIAAGELKARRLEDAYPIVDQGYEMPEPLTELATALAELSPSQRAATILCLRDGYSAAEAADIIGSTAGAVRVHLHRARRRLRDLLDDADA
jgi:RNA polymerase sigma factor (sigma-70 family)